MSAQQQSFEVPIVYRGQVNYVVTAANPAEAETIARERFAGDAPPTVLGNEWEEIERVGAIAAVGPRGRQEGARASQEMPR